MYGPYACFAYSHIIQGVSKKTVIKKSKFFADYLRLQTFLRKGFALKIKLGAFAL